MYTLQLLLFYFMLCVNFGQTSSSAQWNCADYEFQCQNRRWCIPIQWKCDGNNDCFDWSDEANCQFDKDLQRLGVVSKEKQLHKKLMDRYKAEGKEGRPVAKTTDSINVFFGLSLIDLLDIDVKNGILTLLVWKMYEWRDNLLTWDPRKFDNITDIRIPPDKIWFPDIYLYNFADERPKVERDANVVARSSGDILFMPQVIIRSSCRFNILYFPFDEQICELKFGSWTYNGLKLNLHLMRNLSSIEMTDYVGSNAWIITKHEAHRHVKYYTCCPEPYPDLKFKLAFRRRVGSFILTIILPCTLLSLLTLVTFWIPPEAPAKLLFGINIFIAFLLLLLLLADSVPSLFGSSLSLIVLFFYVNMILIVLSTVQSCFVANIYFRGAQTNRAPRWLRKIMIDILAPVCCLQTGAEEADMIQLGQSKRKSKATHPGSGTSVEENTTEEQDVRSAGTSGEEMLDELRVIRDILEQVRDKRAKVEEGKNYLQEWRVIARVADRLMFVFYLVLNGIGFGYIAYMWGH